MSKHRSFRGREVDMDEIRRQNETTVTVGNTPTNARGDVIDDYGNVVQSRDQVARQNKKSYTTATREASIISSFEDEDDEVLELKDDPKVLKTQQNKSQGQSKTSSQKSTTEQKSSTTDLDDE